MNLKLTMKLNKVKVPNAVIRTAKLDLIAITSAQAQHRGMKLV